jgi:hypothetical protein
MSDGHEHDAHEGAADAHHDHGFDGEPATELGPDEPMTPGWLPALGGVLFVGLALFGLAESRDSMGAGKPAASADANANAAQTAAQPVQQAPRPVQMPTRPQALPSTMAPAQNAPGSPEIKRLPPSEIKDVMERLKKQGLGQPQPGQPASRPGAQPPPGGH